MNILHLEASTGWGGQEIRIFREAEGMRSRGHQVIIACMKGAKLAEKARGAGFPVYELSFRKSGWLWTLICLLVIFRRHKIDLVNTHSSLDSWIGGIAARIARRRLVRTRHLSTPIKIGLNSRFLYGKLADFVVTTCSSIIPMICEQSKKSPELCRSIATGVDSEKIQCLGKESFRKKWAEDDFLVGTACVMRSWKGIDDLLKAADLLREIKFVIIGGGHAERHIAKAKELKLENVFFTGHLDNPFPAIASLDLFVLLSTANEGVSQALLQAAYLEKPLLTTTTGGLAEVCIHGETGLNVAVFSPEEVAQSILDLQKESSLRHRFGKRAKQLVLEKFTLKHTLDQMEEVYHTVVGKRPSR